MSVTGGGEAQRCCQEIAFGQRRRRAGEPGTFVGIRGDRVGERQQAVADRACHVLRHVEPARIADDRVAQVENIGAEPLRALDEAGDRLHLFRGGHVAGGDRGDPLRTGCLAKRGEQRIEGGASEDKRLDRAHSGVMRQHNRRHEPDGEAEPLEGEGRDAAAHGAARDVAGDDDDGVHRRTRRACAPPGWAGRLAGHARLI
jgi:hypothetical protein